MKEVKAVVHPHMLDRVLDALHELPHFPGVTILDVTGQGRGIGRGHAFEPTLDELSDLRRKLVEIICTDDVAGDIAEAIRRAAHTGLRGDGIITITDIAQVIRIHSGEQQEEAV